MTPQIIYIALILINIYFAGLYHDKPKEGNHDAFITILRMILMTSLLFWGGFFDKLFK